MVAELHQFFEYSLLPHSHPQSPGHHAGIPARAPAIDWIVPESESLPEFLHSEKHGPDFFKFVKQETDKRYKQRIKKVEIKNKIKTRKLKRF